ncbi:Pimeloyl-ACP methyl ester carboxylesterase [Aeromonas sp. RU39B]|uniref:alpha/beta fold hydrolase n=1 Tax=Aeromonas sp. RU39B TaxID=1907416 RepID=UPI000956FAEF|nr:alpha/beta hydrolase [Aeromonas sp. RU39B]SIQ15281.1 Pimeloyl-ACP methyl ester carboxylesterase [Aeromonas sp. RU39B]
MRRKRREVRVKGLYQRSAGEGPLLLFLHGLGSSSLDWQAQLEYFSSHYRAVALDLRGHGLSLRDGPFDVPTLAADVLQWLDEQPGQVVLIGLSLGAMVALEVALARPQRVVGMMLINGFAEFSLDNEAAKADFTQRLKWLRWIGMLPLGWWLARKLFPDSEQGSLRQTFRRRFRRNNKRVYKQILEALPGWSVRARLGVLSQPVAVVSSSDDYLPLAKRVAQFAALPNASVYTPSGHHAWPAEDPAACNSLLARFLANLNYE